MNPSLVASRQAHSNVAIYISNMKYTKQVILTNKQIIAVKCIHVLGS